jgi:diguanylate cyclase (GGDEF)-like protein
MNVLLVESDPDDLARVEQTLRGEEYVLSIARSPEEALRQLGIRDTHIILVSSMLPHGGAYELARSVRSLRHETPSQILMLASEEERGDIQKALDNGFDDFLSEPLGPGELAARTKAARIRWESQATLVKEREFFRIAVAEEERLSSLVLDQNQSLKEAYEKIRRLNEELEKANKELEQIAAYDSLTGLLNRRSLFSRIAVEIERSIRLDVPLTGLMIDIDHFKNINDNYGHQCGDMVIRDIGARLLAGLRKYDYAGRYGGEEFFIVLSNSTEQQSLGIGERFRKDMEEARFSCGGDELVVTVSIGVARYIQGESQESWIERTDRAMYQAKQGGRNRIITD